MAGERIVPGIGLTAFWDEGSDGWKPGMDANLLKVSVLTQCSVISQTTALPGSPTNGDMYIVPSGAGSNPNELAIRDNGAWAYFTPTEGFLVYVKDTDKYMKFDGSAWADLQTAAKVEFSFFKQGVMTNNELLFRHIVKRAFTFPSALSGSAASAVVAATASTVVTVRKNGTAAGTATWAISGTTATLAMASPTAFAVDDVLTVTGQATADATLADVSMTLVGNL